MTRFKAHPVARGRGAQGLEMEMQALAAAGWETFQVLENDPTEWIILARLPPGVTAPAPWARFPGDAR